MSENIKSAISILEQASEEVALELQDQPALQLKASNTLEKLINGFKHVAGIAISNFDNNDNAIKPAKSFMGVNLEELESQNQPAKVEVPADEKEIFANEVRTIYSTFLEKDTKQIAESIKKEHLLGVAKLAGIVLENPSSQNVTQKFVNEIKAAITKKNEDEAARLEAQKALQNEGPKDLEEEIIDEDKSTNLEGVEMEENSSNDTEDNDQD